ncbi:MAG TPA: hypothetical protein VLF66_11805 [Thermoanaerobaculia bacterium]|nr:hypothetical protein [Thermoanaerobaculia bacterium]
MIRSIRGQLLLVLALAAVLAAPAALADVYHVILQNGGRYESRHPPEEAAWDAGTLLVYTETGNWVGVARDRIVRVESETEIRGHGQRIDATTVYMGRTANAAPAPGTEGGETDPQLQLLQAIYDRQLQQESYTIEQFVEPGATGGGIPVGFTQQVTPPIGAIPPNR